MRRLANAKNGAKLLLDKGIFTVNPRLPPGSGFFFAPLFSIAYVFLGIFLGYTAMNGIIKKIINALTSLAKSPERSAVWLQGWEDSAHGRGYKNMHPLDTEQWKEYMEGYRHWKKDSLA